MENKKTDNTHSDIYKQKFKSFKTSFIKNYINAIRKKNQHQQKKNNAEEITKGIERTSSTEKINTISTVVLTIATCILAYYTFYLFKETQNVREDNKEAIDAAVKGANNSDITVKEQRYNDSVTRYHDSVKSTSDNINERKRFSQDSLSIQSV